MLGIEASHLLTLSQLPLHHRDPFDRMLIAQALTETVPIASRDRMFGLYGVENSWSLT
ncbi:PIN domain-containing protein [Spirosoma luteolum]